jgi:pSer/pThr/pTyr-binding forkhead associated (FHA) protein
LLRVVDGRAAGTTIDLGPDPLVIGRSEADPGRLGDDPELSRRHAQISTRDGQILVEDLGSTNGTFVNGERIAAPTPVRPGDHVEVGATKLEVLAPEAPSGPPERRLALRVVAGWAPGALIPLGEGSLTLGRGQAGASALGDDPTLAERHVKISPLGDERVEVRDLGSETGTLVQGERIAGPTILAEGDRFQVGRATLEIVLAAGSAAEPEREPRRVVGGVQEVPEGLFAKIAARAPVTREEVTKVFLLSLGWALAANLLIRVFAIETLDVPEDLRALEFPGFLVGIFFSTFFNSFGFYMSFRRPDDASMKKYIIPCFGFPAFFAGLNLLLSNHDGALEVAITVILTVVPPTISTLLMLRLREQVSRERVGALRAA